VAHSGKAAHPRGVSSTAEPLAAPAPAALGRADDDRRAQVTPSPARSSSSMPAPAPSTAGEVRSCSPPPLLPLLPLPASPEGAVGGPRGEGEGAPVNSRTTLPPTPTTLRSKPMESCSRAAKDPEPRLARTAARKASGVGGVV